MALPLFDGEIGIARDHTPLIGRLGYGEMRITRQGKTVRYYVEGGFVEVAEDVVTVLASRAVPSAELDDAVAEEQLRPCRPSRPARPRQWPCATASRRRAGRSCGWPAARDGSRRIAIMTDPIGDLKHREEEKRHRCWDPLQRWQVLQDTSAWADAQAAVSRNTPGAMPGASAGQAGAAQDIRQPVNEG